jgi:hypothetical protein
MTREHRTLLRAGWLSFSAGTLLSLTLNATTGCSSSPPPEPAAPGMTAAPVPNPCVQPFMGATKAAPILPPECRTGPLPPSEPAKEPAVQQQAP